MHQSDARTSPGIRLPSPGEVDPSWLPLRQAWREQTECDFQPGWARVRWIGSSLSYDVVLAARSPRNRARRLNEPTWELGDVCEIFAESPGDSQYLEVHVTPENQRLQLRWTKKTHDAFSAGKMSLADAMESNPQWVESASEVSSGYWRVAVLIPGRLVKNGERKCLRTAVCRYDCDSPNGPVLSSTADLRQPCYHRLKEWNQIGVGERGR